MDPDMMNPADDVTVNDTVAEEAMEGTDEAETEPTEEVELDEEVVSDEE